MAGTDLYIKWRDAPADDGTRPIAPCGTPNAVWNNQSIWLSTNTSPFNTLTEATVGQQLRVNVRVTNKSSGATFNPEPFTPLFIKVQVWICNYTVGVGPPGGIASAGGQAGQEADITTSIAAGGTAVTHVLWTPAVGDLDIPTPGAGQGHVCAAANVYWTGTTPPAESKKFLPPPPTEVLSICGDGSGNLGGHHGQKNLVIVPAPPGPFMMAMNVFGLRDEPEVNFIEALEAPTAEVGFRMAERELLLAHDWVRLLDGKRGVKARTIEGHPIEPVERARLRAGGRLVLRDGNRPIRFSRRHIENFRLHGGEEPGTRIPLDVDPKRPRRIELRWNQPNEKPGAVHVFDVEQRTRQRRLLGGTRVVAVTVREPR